MGKVMPYLAYSPPVHGLQNNYNTAVVSRHSDLVFTLKAEKSPLQQDGLHACCKTYGVH